MSINWGQPDETGITTTTAFQGTRAQGNISPNTAGMTLDSISFWGRNTIGSPTTLRMALYQGGALDDIAGATLIEDLGTITMPASMGAAAWFTRTSPTNPAIPQNTLIWVVCGWGAAIDVSFGGSSYAGDFQSARGPARVESPHPTFVAGGAPATLSATTFATSYLPLYMTYSVAASGPSPAAIHDYLTLNGLTPGV